MLSDEHFEIAQLRSVTEGNLALESELVRLFLDTAESCLAALEGLVFDDADLQRSLDVIHTLKGASANIGTFRMQQLCEAIEAASTAEERKKTYASLRQEYWDIKPRLVAICA